MKISLFNDLSLLGKFFFLLLGFQVVVVILLMVLSVVGWGGLILYALGFTLSGVLHLAQQISTSSLKDIIELCLFNLSAYQHPRNWNVWLYLLALHCGFLFVYWTYFISEKEPEGDQGDTKAGKAANQEFFGDLLKKRFWEYVQYVYFMRTILIVYSLFIVTLL